MKFVIVCVFVLCYSAVFGTIVKPTEAERFARSFGMNSHSGFGTAPYNQLDALQQWLIRLGVRVIRDRFSRVKQPEQQQHFQALYNSGAQIHSTIMEPDTDLPSIKSLFPSGSSYPASKVFRSLGGLNEPNNAAVTRGARTWDWAIKYRDHQKLLYSKTKADTALSVIPVCSGALKDQVPDLTGDSHTGNWMLLNKDGSWSWEGTGPKATVSSQAAMLRLTTGKGTVAIRTDVSDIHGIPNCHFLLQAADGSVLSNWVKLQFHPGLLSSQLSSDPIARYVNCPDYHKYPGGGNNPSAGLDDRTKNALDAYAGANKTMYCTEGSYHTALNAATGGAGVPYDVQAKYELVLWAEHYRAGLKQNGIGQVWFHYEFLDGVDHTSTYEESFGFINMTSLTDTTTWKAKPIFRAFQNMLRIVGDRSAGPGASGAHLNFPMTALNLTITGLPSTGDYFLLQKQDNTFWLVIWRDERLYSPGAAVKRLTLTPASVTISSPVKCSWQVFTPYVSSTGGTAQNGTSKVLALGEDLLVVKIGVPSSILRAESSATTSSDHHSVQAWYVVVPVVVVAVLVAAAVVVALLYVRQRKTNPELQMPLNADS